jgi:hydroxymethylbilane synthase
MPERIREYIAAEVMLPANGQGAVGIECRNDDEKIKALLAPLGCEETRIRVIAERAMNRALEGGCQVPIGSYAVLEGQQIHLRGLVGAIDGSEILTSDVRGSINDAAELGNQLAEQLLAKGADKILRQVYEQV